MTVLIGDSDIGAAWEGGGNRPAFSEDTPLQYAANQAQNTAVNASLREDEWEVIDDRVNEEASNRLGVVDRWRDAGLTEDLGVGDIERVTERLEAFDEADISFDGETDPQRDRPNYLQDRRAVPIISQDFRIGFRQLASSRKRGNNLQTDSAGLATRAVTHRMQDLVTNGLASGAPSGGGIPGLTSATNRLTDNSFDQWSGSSGTPIEDVESMLSTLYSNFLFGEFELHVPKNYWALLQGDYSDNKGDRTFLERIEAFEDISAVIPNDSLADHNLVLVQMTRDVMDISEAQTMTTWQWEKTPAATEFRVLMIAGPHVKSIETEDGSTVNGFLHSDLS